MSSANRESPLVLSGIDGGNPLGFLSALGAAIFSNTFCPDTRFLWSIEGGAWRPALTGCDTDKDQFVGQLLAAMNSASMEPFEIDSKLPFSVERFAAKLKEVQGRRPSERRVADFLAAFGSEINPEKEVFRDSRFRMVRSGDSAGQGLPAYAKNIRAATDEESLKRTLFMPWNYQDSGFTLRWDPIDDQRYALRWRDPSKSNLKDGPGTMSGANSLAIEALQWFPTMVRSNRIATTGFYRNSDNEVWFTWPIWDSPISLDVVRSVLALPDLHRTQPSRAELAKRGIVEIYRSQRIQQNKYYSNFTPGQPA